MNFPLEISKIVLRTFLSGSRERVYQQLNSASIPARVQQLGLALCSLGFALAFVVYLLLPFSGLVLSVFFRLSLGAEPAEWIFWLGGNNWLGLFCGVFLGMLLRLVFRVSGISFLVAGGFLLTGIMSLDAAWGVFLGDFIAGSIENGIRFPQKEFRLRSGLALAFGLGGLVVTPLLQAFVMGVFVESYSAYLRWLQWGSLVFGFLFVETLTSLLFFHFYYAQSQKLTKV